MGALIFRSAATGVDVEPQSQEQRTLTIPFTARVFVPPYVLIRQVEGESVLLNLQDERYFGLDEVGTRIWALLTSSDSIQTAFEALLNEYDVEAEQLRRNLYDLIGKLVENGLVEVGGG